MTRAASKNSPKRRSPSRNVPAPGFPDLAQVHRNGLCCQIGVMTARKTATHAHCGGLLQPVTDCRRGEVN
jgi:hypothetical protein